MCSLLWPSPLCPRHGVGAIWVPCCSSSSPPSLPPLKRTEEKAWLHATAIKKKKRNSFFFLVVHFCVGVCVCLCVCVAFCHVSCLSSMLAFFVFRFPPPFSPSVRCCSPLHALCVCVFCFLVVVCFLRGWWSSHRVPPAGLKRRFFALFVSRVYPAPLPPLSFVFCFLLFWSSLPLFVMAQWQQGCHCGNRSELVVVFHFLDLQMVRFKPSELATVSE